MRMRPLPRRRASSPPDSAVPTQQSHPRNSEHDADDGRPHVSPISRPSLIAPSPSTALLAILATLAVLPCAYASPLTPRRPSSPRRRSAAGPRPEEARRQPPAYLVPFVPKSQVLRRQSARSGGLPDLYEVGPDGAWMLANGWVLHGKSYDQRDGSPEYDPSKDGHTDLGGDGSTSDGTDAPKDGTNSTSNAASTSPASASTSTSTFAATATGTAAASSSASSSNLPDGLPNGWQPAPSRTQLYAVPIIIVMAVCLAFGIVTVIILSVSRHRRKKAREKAKLAGAADPDADLSEFGGGMDLEKLRRRVEKAVERKRKEEEKEARKGIRMWLRAGERWQARLSLRQRPRRKKKTDDKGSASEDHTVSIPAAPPTSPRPSSTFVRSASPSPSPHLPRSPRFLPASALPSRATSPTPSLPPAVPPAYASPSSSPSLSPETRMYPDLPTPPPGSLHPAVVPTRAHVATDDKRALARMARAARAPGGSTERAMAVLEPEVPEWTDESFPDFPEPAPPAPDPPSAFLPPPAFSFPAPPAPYSVATPYDMNESEQFLFEREAEADEWDEFGGASAPPIEEMAMEGDVETDQREEAEVDANENDGVEVGEGEPRD